MRIGAMLTAMFLVGCDGQGVPNGQCSTGQSFSGGEDAGGMMEPGNDCIACHEGGEGPRFTVAGTVMGAVDDPDNCVGVDGVIVRLTDADGVVHELDTNGNGNFYTTEAVPGPFTAEVESGGNVVQMVTPQTDGNCMACHTDAGANGAPGRILAP